MAITNSFNAKNGLSVGIPQLKILDSAGNTTVQGLSSTSLHVGVSALVVGNNANVGIGVVVPTERLTVNGNISATNSVFASGGNSQLWNQTRSVVQSNSANWQSTYTTFNNNSACFISSICSSGQGNLLTVNRQGSVIGSVFLTDLSTCGNPTFCNVTVCGKIGVGLNSINGGLHANVIGLSSSATGRSSTAFGEGVSATGLYSTVAGGFRNTASAIYSTVGGGTSNTAVEYSTVGGGIFNTASGYYGYSTVGGGRCNTASGSYSTVGGGSFNTASSYYGRSTVGGGSSNTASGVDSTIGGGTSNTASGDASTIGGGAINTASGAGSTIGGGVINTASGSYSTIGGGNTNTACGLYSTVGGGINNIVLSLCSAILGGSQNCIKSGDNNAFIIGSNITSTKSCATFMNETVIFGPLSAQTTISGLSGRFNDNIEILTSSKGIVLVSPDNTKYLLTVNNDGSLQTTSI